MNGRSHLVTGAAVGASYGALTGSLILVVPCAFVTAAGALAPDLDHPRSLASRAVPVVSPILSGLARAVSFGAHRTTTHWLPLWAALSLLMAQSTTRVPGGAGHVLIVAFCLGYVGHLLEDAMTVDGIPLLLPVGHWHVLPGPLRFKSAVGGIGERAAVTLIIVACIGVVLVARVPEARAAYTHLLLTLAHGVRGVTRASSMWMVVRAACARVDGFYPHGSGLVSLYGNRVEGLSKRRVSVRTGGRV